MAILSSRLIDESTQDDSCSINEQVRALLQCSKQGASMQKVTRVKSLPQVPQAKRHRLNLQSTIPVQKMDWCTRFVETIKSTQDICDIVVHVLSKVDFM